MRPDDTAESALLADASEEVSDLEMIIQRRRSPRQRAFQLGLTVIALIAVAATLFIINPNALAFLSPAPPSSTSSPFAQFVYLAGSTNYGLLTISSPGHPTRVETDDAFSRGGTTGIYQGLNRFTLDAPPFGHYACTLHWPLASTDTCRIFQEGSEPLLVDLSVGLDNMPPDVHDNALATINKVITDANTRLQTSVSVGAYIATGSDSQQGLPLYQRAPAGTTAAFALTVAPETADNLINNCVVGQSICPQYPTVKTLQHTWGVLVMTQVQWHFTDATGAVIATVPPQGLPFLMNLAYMQGSWQIIANDTPMQPMPQAFDDNPYDDAITTSCGVAIPLIAPHLAPADPVNGAFPGAITYIGRPSVAGCALRFQLDAINGKPRGIYIVRFGVIYAGDATAHDYMPTLPVASAAVIAAGEQ